MKLSEMTTTQLADCLVNIAVPIANIAEDDEVVKALQTIAASYESKPIVQLSKEVIVLLVPLALKKHRADVLAVLAALTGKTVLALSKQNGLETILEAKGVVDKELISFFSSLAGTKESA